MRICLIAMCCMALLLITPVFASEDRIYYDRTVAKIFRRIYNCYSSSQNTIYALASVIEVIVAICLVLIYLVRSRGKRSAVRES